MGPTWYVAHLISGDGGSWWPINKKKEGDRKKKEWRKKEKEQRERESDMWERWVRINSR